VKITITIKNMGELVKNCLFGVKFAKHVLHTEVELEEPAEQVVTVHDGMEP